MKKSVLDCQLGNCPKLLACEQALRGTLAAGQEKEGELATTSLEFEYLHWKSWCEMLMGGDDISNDVITFLTCFSVFVYIFHTCFYFRANWLRSDSSFSGEPQGNWRWKSDSRDVIASSPSFSRSAARAPWRACLQATQLPISPIPYIESKLV